MQNKDINLGYKKDAVALVGIGCRFPGGADSAEKFWELLCEGKDVVVPIPENRWSRKKFYNKNRSYKGKTVSQYGGFLDNIEEFDAQFFGITPREAPYMDPQQRLLLETSWEAMEDAGMVTEEYAGKDVGVFMGAFTLDYKILQFSGNNYDLIDVHTATGAMMTMVANRISYQFDFTGPSMAIDTACSSSLVSIHTACQSIRNGECSMALAGGVLLNMAPQYTIAESQGGFLSVDGKCKTFDESANGYVRGEGVGVVVLKRLEDAIRDKDLIYSVILGSAVNQDGHTSSITVPNPEAQKKVIRTALSRANVEAKDIQYVEMHGTGTSVGDPLEAEAISEVMSEGRAANEPCIVGSVKTNIGHTEGAAGVASIIKASLCLSKKKIPPHLNLNHLNPKIKLDEYNISVPESLMDWPDYGKTALAGVNGFGFGGTNSHIVLGEAPERKFVTGKHEDCVRLYPITARSEGALKEYAKQYYDLVEGLEEDQLYDLGYSMTYKRDCHNVRLGILAKGKQELLQKLEHYIADEEDLRVVAGKKKKKDNGVVFVYTGMGPQWWKMGQQLMKTEPVFLETLEKCDKEFVKYSGWSLIEAMSATEEESKMSQTYVAQSTNFALQVALTELWKSKGVTPDAIIGHSAGEIAAFYCAGVMGFEDAIKAIYYRSSLQQRLTGKGKMLAVSLSLEEVQEYVKRYDSVDIVAINSVSGITLVGEESDLSEISAELEEKKLFNKFLRVNVPFHSHFMEEIKDEFIEGVKDITLHKPTVKLYSSVTGEYVEEVENNLYWWKNVRQTVLFAPAIEKILKDKYDTFVEIGPHPALSNYINEIAADKRKTVYTFSSLNRKIDEVDNFYHALGGLFSIGSMKDFSKMYGEEGNYIKLPFYPWQREKYWLENESARKRRLGIFDHIILGHKMDCVEPCWELELNENVLPFIANHKIQGNTLFPAAGYIEMAMEAAKQYYGDGYLKITDIAFLKATFINPNKAVKLQITINTEEPSFKIYNMTDNEVAVCGKYKQEQNLGERYHTSIEDVKAVITENNLVSFEQEDIYTRFEEMGFGYYNHFRALNQLWAGENETVACIKLTDLIKEEKDSFTIHPGMIDACFQTVIATGFVREEDLRLPVGLKGFSVYRPIQEEMWVHCRVIENTAEQSISEIKLYGSDGTCIADFNGFVVNVLEGSTKKPNLQSIDSWLYEFDWVEKERVPHEAKKEEGSWIILQDQKGIGAQFRTMLEQRGEKCVSIALGDQVSEDMTKDSLFIRASVEEDMSSAIEAIAKKGTIKGLVQFFNLDFVNNAEIDREQICSVSEKSVYTTIHAIKALVQQEVKKTKMYFVTSGAQILDSKEEGQILQRPVWGLARLIRNQENNGYWGGVVDLQPGKEKESLEQFLLDVLEGDSEDQLAYRDGKRYVGRLQNIETLTKPFPVRLSSEGFYMVTGAFGEIGKLATKWLVEKGAKKVLLVGRSTVPAREQWNDSNLDERTVERIEFVKDIEREGVTVLTASLDMSNEDAINEYFHANVEIKQQIKGIISAAGIVKDMLMTEMPKEVFDSVYNTKTIGNWTLHKQFEHQDLEFFVMFSSVTTMLAATGQVNYISANAFLDALADYRRKKGQTALSIAWGPWDIGMIRQLNLQETYIRKGMIPITAIKGISTLERIIKQNISYALVLEADWVKVTDSIPRNPIPYLDHLKGETGEKESENLSDEELLELFYEQYKNAEEGEAKQKVVADKVIQLVSKVLHMAADKIEIESSLSELGIDSMMTTELKNRIELNTGAVIKVVDLLNNESIEQLAGLVEQQVKALLEMDSVEDLAEELSEEELELMLQEIASMSEEEIQNELE